MRVPTSLPEALAMWARWVGQAGHRIGFGNEFAVARYLPTSNFRW